MNKQPGQDMIFAFIRSIFKKNKDSNPDDKKSSPVYEKRADTPDFIDYDGMGNQGRFPSKGKK